MKLSGKKRHLFPSWTEEAWEEGTHLRGFTSLSKWKGLRGEGWGFFACFLSGTRGGPLALQMFLYAHSQNANQVWGRTTTQLTAKEVKQSHRFTIFGAYQCPWFPHLMEISISIRSLLPIKIRYDPPLIWFMMRFIHDHSHIRRLYIDLCFAQIEKLCQIPKNTQNSFLWRGDKDLIRKTGLETDFGYVWCYISGCGAADVWRKPAAVCVDWDFPEFYQEKISYSC